MESGEEAVKQFLSGIGLLESCGTALISDGFDSLMALRAAREADLLAAGIKRGHARLIVATLGESGAAAPGEAVEAFDVPGVRSIPVRAFARGVGGSLFYSARSTACNEFESCRGAPIF